MKRLILTAIIALLLGSCNSGSISTPVTNPSPSQIPSATPTSTVSLTLEYADTIATYSAQPNQRETVLSLLERITSDNQIPLEVTQYDFGTMVTAIANHPNTSTLAWIYFINDQPGNMGADQQSINPGDHISWKHIKPTY